MCYVHGFSRFFGTFLVLSCMFFSVVLYSPAHAVEKSYLSAMSFQQLGGKAPDMTILNGSKKVSLEDYRGKTVMLHFWARCKPCMDELPAIESLYQEYNGKGLVLLAINIEPGVSQKEINAFANKLGVTFPIYLFGRGMVPDSYWEAGEPQTYLIDGKGNFIGRAFGSRDWKSKEAFGIISRLLEKK